MAKRADKTTRAGEEVKKPPESGSIVWDKDVCTGCGTCESMCSLYHDGITGPAFARLRVVEHHFSEHFEFHACRQCLYPSCYFACPLSDRALCIDEATGARFINEDECIGCKKCIEACPFDPPRIRFNDGETVSFKCDLCRGREGGPICVEYCFHETLKFVARAADKEQAGA